MANNDMPTSLPSDFDDWKTQEPTRDDLLSAWLDDEIGRCGGCHEPDVPLVRLDRAAKTWLCERCAVDLPLLP